MTKVEDLSAVDQAVQFLDASRCGGSIILQVSHASQLGLVRRRVAEILGTPSASHADKFRYGVAFVFFEVLSRSEDNPEVFIRTVRGHYKDALSIPVFLVVECHCEECLKRGPMDEIDPGVKLPVPGDDLALERFFGISGWRGFW